MRLVEDELFLKLREIMCCFENYATNLLFKTMKTIRKEQYIQNSSVRNIGKISICDLLM